MRHIEAVDSYLLTDVLIFKQIVIVSVYLLYIKYCIINYAAQRLFLHVYLLYNAFDIVRIKSATQIVADA